MRGVMVAAWTPPRSAACWRARDLLLMVKLVLQLLRLPLHPVVLPPRARSGPAEASPTATLHFAIPVQSSISRRGKDQSLSKKKHSRPPPRVPSFSETAL
eukprot:CAMPEP_0182607864 /NCGR_PEP_ID=MMETSP1330-20130603/2442_1 /TAXON_ID=464278 /ORGANISM="Picochlorum sp., Strain RCC944" /LENGTH=99 /DNA_ID=CAMNT_0024826523 /DNA_START=42 /DNA_END=341 /DNA_ORIENTATION=-